MAKGPLYAHLSVLSPNPLGDQLAESDTKVDASSRDTPKNDGCDLRAHQRTKGQVESQTKSQDELADQEPSSRSSDDLSNYSTRADEDTCCQAGLSACSVGDPARKKATEELPDGADDVECCLPACWEDCFAFEMYLRLLSTPKGIFLQKERTQNLS